MCFGFQNVAVAFHNTRYEKNMTSLDYETKGTSSLDV